MELKITSPSSTEKILFNPILSGPLKIDVEFDKAYKDIEIFSQPCMELENWMDTVDVVVQEIFHVYTGHHLDWVELRSKKYLYVTLHFDF